jgi:diacylglycerol O-acyltransferase 2, plant
MFEQLATSDGLLGRISRAMRAGVTFFWGQYGLPIPFPAKVRICLGDVIPVEQVEEPTEEQITTLQNTYMAHMQELFDKYKAAAGYPDAVLQIT